MTTNAAQINDFKPVGQAQNVSSTFQQQQSQLDKEVANPFDDQPIDMMDLQNKNIEEEENPFADDSLEPNLKQPKLSDKVQSTVLKDSLDDPFIQPQHQLKTLKSMVSNPSKKLVDTSEPPLQQSSLASFLPSMDL